MHSCLDDIFNRYAHNILLLYKIIDITCCIYIHMQQEDICKVQVTLYMYIRLVKGTGNIVYVHQTCVRYR